MRIFILVFFYFLSICSLPAVAYASTTDWTKEEEAQSRLIAGDKLETGAIRAGLEIRLGEGWHTYWRSPGDAGMPPSIDWSKSENVKSVEFLYPAPTRFLLQFQNYEPTQTFGYENHVLFPLLVTPENPAYTTVLTLKAKYAVCKELCLFFDHDYSLRIPNNLTDADTTKLIDTAIAGVPGKSTGLTISDVSLNEAGKTLDVNISGAEPLAEPDIFVEVTPDFKFMKPQFFFAEDKKSAVAKIPYQELLADKHVKGLGATLMLKSGGKAAEKKLTLGAPNEKQAAEVPAKSPFETNPLLPGEGGAHAPGEGVSSVTMPSPQPSPEGRGGIAFILFAAFIGGLILNIMPCVLPVLSLKLLGIVKHGGGTHSHVRASFLASAAGILVSFLALAGIVIALKAVGVAVGWGFHFQQPLFVIALIVLINLFAASQWSLFDIQLPYWLGGRLSTVMSEADEHSLTGHFMTGVLATILATPCSAPYLGTAVGFALSQGAVQILLVFAVMGLGLASPYLLFTLAPGLVTRLPRPGAWMLHVKHLMGYLLAATSGWLIWVLSMQIGMVAAAVVAGLSLGSILMLYVYRIRPFGKNLLAAVILAGLAVTFTLPQVLAEKARPAQGMDTAMWQPFSEKAIPGLVAEGKTVFVDVTADWCLTCKFNKLHVLYVGRTHEALMRPDVVTMKADYTNPSKQITDFLHENGRYGIPFNIIYGPKAPEGIALSEYLTEQAVLDALKSASGK